MPREIAKFQSPSEDVSDFQCRNHFVCGSVFDAEQQPKVSVGHHMTAGIRKLNVPGSTIHPS
ncbi:MAG: hypothetical protein ACK58T_45165, partial [Phycisphaerae bacterium]